MSTFNKVLIAALVVQVGLALVIRASSDSGEALRNPEPLLAGFDGSEVTRIALFDEPRPEDDSDDKAGDDSGDEAGKDAQGEDEPAIDLRRTSNGSEVTWTLASHFGHPVKTSEVNTLLEKLASLQSRGPVVTSEVRHGQLHVAADDYRRKVVIETGAGKTTLYVGAPAGSRQVSVRLDGQDAVHQVGEISAAGLSLSPTAWLDTTYLDLPHDQVAYMAVRNQAGTYELQRTERGRWSLVQDGQPYPIPAGTQFNGVAADNWVKEAVRINLAEPADPDRAIDTPLATITLRLKPKAPDEAPDASAAGGQGEGQAQGQTGGEDTAAQAQDGGVAEVENTAQPAAAGTEVAGAAQGGEAAAGTVTGETAVSQGFEEYVIEIGAEEDGNYYVRLQGSPTAAMVRKASLRNLVEMNDGVVLIPAEK